MQPPIPEMKSVKSIVQYNAAGVLVDVECHISNGLPAIIIVGLGNKAVDEAKERIRSAFSSSAIPFPRKRITINLAPADVPKDSTGLDLAIATAILQADQTTAIKYSFGSNEALIGELGLDGSLRPVRGIIGKLLAGHEKGISVFYIPKANLPQASLLPGIRLIALETFREYTEALRIGKPFPYIESGVSSGVPKNVHTPSEPILSYIAGQRRAKRALEIAAAGGHNVFLSGPPGTGKSMLAKALPSMLPQMTIPEILEVTHLHSLASSNYNELVTIRPFRSPHHSASYVSLVGGGAQLRPGEISLSHRGILFLDEMPEFSRRTLESLRQPLEDNQITIARAREVAIFPANFILVATANPCPCGYYGTAHECQCPAHIVLQYRQKVSGPIMDRFDLYVEVEEVSHTELLRAVPNTEDDRVIKERVLRARERQQTRYASSTLLNSDLTNKMIRAGSHMTPESHALLDQAASKLRLSARSYMRIIKVARTIADLEDSDALDVAHMGEALQYRSRNLDI